MSPGFRERGPQAGTPGGCIWWQGLRRRERRAATAREGDPDGEGADAKKVRGRARKGSWRPLWKDLEGQTMVTSLGKVFLNGSHRQAFALSQDRLTSPAVPSPGPALELMVLQKSLQRCKLQFPHLQNGHVNNSNNAC